MPTQFGFADAVLQMWASYLAERAGEPSAFEPWLWTGPLERTYLVYAMRFERL